MARHINIEMKARCANLDQVRNLLSQRQARFVGMDHQRDTYFCVPEGRLKLREGNIERALIFYRRSEEHGARTSDVMLYPVRESEALRAILSAALGVRVTVDKQREIWIIENVKFHLDHVDGLGSYVEIEAIGGPENVDQLRAQCAAYMDLFGITDDATEPRSYSDLLEKNR